MDKNKLILPITILVASILLGIFFYAGQISTQKFIERQLKIKSQADQAMAEKDKTDRIFSNNVKCQTLLISLRQKWNNMVGTYYDESKNTCIVKYSVKDKIEEAPFEEMKDIK